LTVAAALFAADNYSIQALFLSMALLAACCGFMWGCERGFSEVTEGEY